MLYTFMLLQALHSTFFVAISAAEVFLNEYWQSSFERLLASLIVLPILIAALWGMTHIRRWAWGLVLIMAVDLVCFAGWYWRYEDVLPKIVLTAQLALIPLILIILVRTRPAFRTTGADLVIAGTAVMIAALTIFLRARYLPTNQVNWAIDPPFYFEWLVYSNFHWPQENSLALLMMTYLVLRWFIGRATGWRGGV